MSFMDWKDSYSVGMAQIDQQHKKLVELINTLHTAMSQGEGKAVVAKVLDELISYCANHFAAEERLFETSSYPDVADHKEKHRKMTAKVLALQKDVQAGKKAISMDVMNFLEQWLDKHILGTDKNYAPYLKA